MDARELLKEFKRTIDELQAFNEIGKALTSTLDIAEVLKLIMDKVGELCTRRTSRCSCSTKATASSTSRS
ncbi:MAG: hypothetical protein QM765_34220 [Myxococcales bacterium]